MRLKRSRQARSPAGRQQHGRAPEPGGRGRAVPRCRRAAAGGHGVLAGRRALLRRRVGHRRHVQRLAEGPGRAAGCAASFGCSHAAAPCRCTAARSRSWARRRVRCLLWLLPPSAPSCFLPMFNSLQKVPGAPPGALPALAAPHTAAPCRCECSSPGRRRGAEHVNSMRCAAWSCISMPAPRSAARQMHVHRTWRLGARPRVPPAAGLCTRAPALSLDAVLEGWSRPD